MELLGYWIHECSMSAVTAKLCSKMGVQFIVPRAVYERAIHSLVKLLHIYCKSTLCMMLTWALGGEREKENEVSVLKELQV